MEEKNYTGTIPAQKEGDVINAQTVREMPDEQAAIVLYQEAKKRLLDVNNWNSDGARLLGNFQLTDQQGNDIASPAKKGFYFKIDLTGPGTEAGDGFDWVQVEAIENFANQHIESIGMRVRPTANPTSADPDTAHFYNDTSTSTFTVTREHNILTAAIYDRNIEVNSSSDNFIERTRNAVIGFAGKTIFSKIQWESLTDAWLKS
ncbi:hypothetical protein [Dyadobacter luticola]|uniref:Uncharacterized protein n=1 Tax=Dyadobacter luticola TaxID=1979387 RepID=A0A5R9L4Q1_9BACT|nr:hypothetical protein [Dyadobacter luticola]TLV03329.1 hypothetical protein FEN17_06875 [Dyadobacter luticola]